MRVKVIAVMTLAAVLALAPQVFAFGGGGGGSNSISGTVNGGSFNGTCTGNQCTGTFTNAEGGTFEGTFTVFAPEPAAMLLVGLGLIGARYIRRR